MRNIVMIASLAVVVSAAAWGYAAQNDRPGKNRNPRPGPPSSPRPPTGPS